MAAVDMGMEWVVPAREASWLHRGLLDSVHGPQIENKVGEDVYLKNCNTIFTIVKWGTNMKKTDI